MSQSEVITGEVPSRYALALIELAEESRSIPTTEKDMTVMGRLLRENDSLSDICSNPIYAISDKVAALTAVAQSAGLSPLSQNFVGLVAENNRANYLPDIIRRFQTMVADRKGIEVAHISSAAPLTDAQIEQIKDELKKVLGQSVTAQTSVDPDLLGGFVVRVGSKLFDNSLKTKIEDMKLALKEV